MDKLKRVMKIIIIMFILIISCQVCVFAEGDWAQKYPAYAYDEKGNTRPWSYYYDKYVYDIRNGVESGEITEYTQEMQNIIDIVAMGPRKDENGVQGYLTEDLGNYENSIDLIKDEMIEAQGRLNTIKEIQQNNPSSTGSGSGTGSGSNTSGGVQINKSEGEKLQKEIEDDYVNQKYDVKKMSDEDLQALGNKIKQAAAMQGMTVEEFVAKDNGGTITTLWSEVITEGNSRGVMIDEKWSEEVPIYHSPYRTSQDRQKDDILKEVIDNAEKFTQSGDNSAIDNNNFRTIMSFIYSMFFQIGVVAAVIIAIVLAIKFMLSSLEQKAEVKKMLGVYVIACVVIFGSFGIWKLVLTILDQM